MSRADYWICPVCDGKALYDDSVEDQPDSARPVTVVHDECLALVATRAVETAARANAEAARAAVMEAMGWEDDRNSGDRAEFRGACWNLAAEIVQAVVEAIAPGVKADSAAAGGQA